MHQTNKSHILEYSFTVTKISIDSFHYCAFKDRMLQPIICLSLTVTDMYPASRALFDFGVLKKDSA